MKRLLIVLLFSGFTSELKAQNEIGPDGDKLVWIFLIVLVPVVLYFVFGRTGNKPRVHFRSLFRRQRICIKLTKDRVYFPDNLSLSIENTGNTDIDLDRPLLVFDNFWLKRNFRINGMNNRSFYPLYLEKGKTHELNIDLNRFYRHDKRLKRYPKVKVRLNNMNGKRLGQRSVYLRKTLIKF